METLYEYLRYLHILAGMIAFFVAPVALAVRKGGNAHIIWGKVFFWAMIAVAFSAVPMTIYNPNLFLFFVAMFSFHLCLSGYRAIQRHKSRHTGRERRTDFIITGVALVAYIGLIGWGIQVITQPGEHAFGYISVAFGIVGLRFSIQEIKYIYKATPGKMDWWFRHMQGMIASYIATLSAFSAVNLLFLPALIRWLWPTVIGGTLLYFWENHYKRKFKQTFTPKQKTA